MNRLGSSLVIVFTGKAQPDEKPMRAKLERSDWRALGTVWLLLLAFVGNACQQVTAPARETSAPSSVSSTVNPTVHRRIGFATRQKLLDHYEKHGREFGSNSAEEYLRQAQQLRDRPASKDVLEVVRADGVVTRFEKSSGAFLAFDANLTIRTFFKPNDGVNYFWRQSRR